MTDIVERLRSFNEELLNIQPWTCEQVAKEAADEIERLRHHPYGHMINERDKEIERLRGALENIIAGRSGDASDNYSYAIKVARAALSQKDTP